MIDSTTENKSKGKQEQDKILRKLLENKEEIAHFVDKFFKYRIRAKDIERYNGKFVTSYGFKVRESDIIYKIKNTEIYIIIEHQSTVDYKMPKRMSEYCICLIDSRQTSKSKFYRAPLIFPIVLSTSKTIWDAPLTILQEEDNNYGFPALNYPTYNLVDIQKITTKKLLEDRMGLTLAMVLEKQKTKEELEKVIEFVIKRGVNEYEANCLKIILENSSKIRNALGKEIGKYKKIMEGDGDMSNFEELYVELLEDKYNKGLDQGISQGISKGAEQIIKQMIKNKMEDKEIIKITNISRKELKRLKLEVEESKIA